MMSFFHRIQLKYLVLVPALFFASIGSIDIITDALNHKLTIGNTLFNAALFTPLALRHSLVYIVSGAIASLFALYAFFLRCWYGLANIRTVHISAILSRPLLSGRSSLV